MPVEKTVTLVLPITVFFSSLHLVVIAFIRRGRLFMSAAVQRIHL